MRPICCPNPTLTTLGIVSVGLVSIALFGMFDRPHQIAPNEIPAVPEMVRRINENQQRKFRGLPPVTEEYILGEAPL